MRERMGEDSDCYRMAFQLHRLDGSLVISMLDLSDPYSQKDVGDWKWTVYNTTGSVLAEDATKGLGFEEALDAALKYLRHLLPRDYRDYKVGMQARAKEKLQETAKALEEATEANLKAYQAWQVAEKEAAEAMRLV